MDCRIRGWYTATASLLPLIVVVAASVSLAAEEPTIQVEVGAEEIYVGDSLDYLVAIRNTQNPPAPDLTAIKEQFDVVANGDESRNQTSITVINGQMTKRNVFSHIYRYRLTPKSTGDLVIPPVTAAIDGKTIKSSEVQLKVIEPEKQDIVLVEIEISQEKVYPTQPFTVTARVLVHPLANNANTDPLTPVRNQPPNLQITWVDLPTGLSSIGNEQWLQPLISDDQVGFSLNGMRSNDFFSRGRVVFGLLKGRDSRVGLDGKPIRYFVYELTRTITPDRTGEYSFGPVSVKGIFVSGTKNGEYVGKRMVAIAPAKSIEVREVPSPRPPTYCGGIGEYSVVSSASPTKLRVGDPLTLTVEFQRGEQSGSLDLISAPDLSAIPQLSDDFDLVDNNPTGRVEGSIKRFSYSMRPKKSNVSIPELNITTFDPKSDSYVDLRTKPISLDVTNAEKISSGDLVGSMTSQSSSSIKSRSQGIFQNVTDPSELRDQRINPMVWFAAAVGIWCLAGCGIAAISIYRRKISDAGWMRRQQARKSAIRRLSAARSLLTEGKPKEALSTVRAAILCLVADMRNRIAEGLTTVDVSAELDDIAVPETDRKAVISLLESIESAEYGGGALVDPSQAIETAANLISRVYPFLERGKP